MYNKVAVAEKGLKLTKGIAPEFPTATTLVKLWYMDTIEERLGRTQEHTGDRLHNRSRRCDQLDLFLSKRRALAACGYTFPCIFHAWHLKLYC